MAGKAWRLTPMPVIIRGLLAMLALAEVLEECEADAGRD